MKIWENTLLISNVRSVHCIQFVKVIGDHILEIKKKSFTSDATHKNFNPQLLCEPMNELQLPNCRWQWVLVKHMPVFSSKKMGIIHYYIEQVLLIHIYKVFEQNGDILL